MKSGQFKKYLLGDLEKIGKDKSKKKENVRKFIVGIGLHLVWTGLVLIRCYSEYG